MKNLLRFSLCFALCLILCTGGALAEFCEYGSADSPCDIIWWVDTQEKLHCRACCNHVTNKEDPYSHVPVTDWEACTPDEGGECTGCGWDYIRDNTGGSGGSGDWGGAAEEELWEMLREVTLYVIETGANPFDVSIADEAMSVALSEDVYTMADAFGLPISESMSVPTEYSFAFEGDTKVYPYTGKAITPATLESSEYGPGRFFTEYGFMEVGEVTYENNVNPGTATASAEFVFIGMEPIFQTLTADFTITGEGIGGEDSKPTHCKYGSDDTCELGWRIDRNNQTHTRICTAHVENKEDMYSYVVVYGPEDCTIGEDEKCTVCHQDYKKDDGTIKPEHYDAYMMEYYYAMGYPIRMWVEEETLFMALSAEYFAALETKGLVIPESMKTPTEYSFAFEGDTKTYPYTGSAVTPATLSKNENGPADFLLRVGLLTVGESVYTDNVNPGEATVSVTFTAKKNITETLTVPFTITGGGSGEGGGADADLDHCEYYTDDFPCFPSWTWDTDNRTHTRVCMNHRSDPSDSYSYAVIAGPDSCSVGEDGKCSVCGYVYETTGGEEEEDPKEKLIDSIYVMLEKGQNVFEYTLSEGVLSIGFTDYAFMTFGEQGISVPQSMWFPTEYTLSYEGGKASYPYTGSPITPVTLVKNEYDLADFLIEHEILRVGELVYEDNVNPGTATVSAEFYLTGLGYGRKILTGEFTITGGGISGGGDEDETEYCEYGSENSPCDIQWSTGKVSKTHSRVCINHVTDKSDPYSYAVVFGPEACTIGEDGTCTVCHYDHSASTPDDEEDTTEQDLANRISIMLEEGRDIFEYVLTSSKLTIGFTDYALAVFAERGISLSESMYVATEYSFEFEGGPTYPYTGSPITPATLKKSEYGPADFLIRRGFFTVGEPLYEDNVYPGTATVSVTFNLPGIGYGEKTLSADFTITGEGIGGGDSKPTHCKYGSDDTCELGWTIDRNNQTHTRICTTHVENKEDMYSYVVVYGPEDCTIGEDEKCTVCHQDYKKDDGTIKPEHYDAYMMEYYYAMGYPIRMWVEDETLFMALSAEYFAALEKQGLVIPDSMKLPTEYSFTFEGDTTIYPYTGSAITPATLGKNENGPADFLLRVGLLTVGDPVYTDNVNPGEATVSVTFTAKKNITETLTVPFTITGGGIGGGDEDETEYCEYGSADSPCDIIWWVDTQDKLHCRACRNHVTDKEDPYSYVPVTEWESCTPDEDGECTGCGYDYIRDNTGGDSGWGDLTDEELYEFYREAMMYAIEMGGSPFDVTIEDETMYVAFSEMAFMVFEEFGLPVSESMAVPTEFSFKFDGSSRSYPYTGKAITPATLTQSEYGPAEFFLNYGFMEFEDVSYKNNVSPGTATASAEFYFIGFDVETYTLSADFTIIGEGGIPGIGGGDDDIKWPLPEKTTLRLPESLTILEDQALMGSRAAGVIVPESCVYVGKQAFADCDSLTVVVFLGRHTTIEPNAFDGCGDLVIVAPAGSEGHAFADDHGYTFMILPE